MINIGPNKMKDAASAKAKVYHPISACNLKSFSPSYQVFVTGAYFYKCLSAIKLHAFAD